MFSVIDSEIISDSPGVFPRLADDKALSVGVSPPLGQNNEQTSAAERRNQTELQMSNMTRWSPEGYSNKSGPDETRSMFVLRLQLLRLLQSCAS